MAMPATLYGLISEAGTVFHVSTYSMFHSGSQRFHRCSETYRFLQTSSRHRFQIGKVCGAKLSLFLRNSIRCRFYVQGTVVSLSFRLLCFGLFGYLSGFLQKSIDDGQCCSDGSCGQKNHGALHWGRRKIIVEYSNVRRSSQCLDALRLVGFPQTKWPKP